jgi:hypothetical protein
VGGRACGERQGALVSAKVAAVFTADPEGFREQNVGRPAAHLVREAVQNVFDEAGPRRATPVYRGTGERQVQRATAGVASPRTAAPSAPRGRVAEPARARPFGARRERNGRSISHGIGRQRGTDGARRRYALLGRAPLTEVRSAHGQGGKQLWAMLEESGIFSEERPKLRRKVRG